jgi:hypothetical protein
VKPVEATLFAQAIANVGSYWTSINELPGLNEKPL